MTDEEEKSNKGLGLKGVSLAALAGALFLILVVVGLILYGIFNTMRLESSAFFWAGVTLMIIAPIAYVIHLVKDNRLSLGATGFCGILGILSIFYSIYIASGSFNDKIMPIIAFSIVVIFLLLIVYGAAGSASKQKERESLRKRT